MFNFDFETLPVWAKLLLAPCLGALFVIFLPVIGFGLLGYAIYKKLAVTVGFEPTDGFLRRLFSKQVR